MCQSRKLLIVTALSLGLFAPPAAMADREPDRGSRSSESRQHDRDGRGRGPRDEPRRPGREPAADHRRDEHHRESRHENRHQRHHDHGRPDRAHDNRDGARHGNHYEDREDYRQGRHRGAYVHRHWQGPGYRIARDDAPRGYVHRHWRAGHRLPRAYYDHRYIVNDYRHYHLHSPPRGHHWIRIDNDVVLAAMATGVVAAVAYDIFR